MLEVLLIILITTLTTLISLSGGFLLLSGSKLAKTFQKYGTIFAAAVLLYAVFGDIVPEALEELPAWQVALYVAIGTAACWLIGSAVGHFHKHGEDTHFKDKKQAYSMLIVDTLHTAMDGIVIGTTFAAGGIGTGLMAAIATAAHEIPQEIGDFSIMIKSKMERQKIIKYQVWSSLVLVPFALISYFIGDFLGSALPPLLSLVAGFFLYIALNEICDIIKVIWQKATKSYQKKELK